MQVVITGRAEIPPAAEVVGPLDELIYRVTSGALADAGLTVADIHGVCMASSDLNDGRAISTMTLTGSTGSYGKTEMRVCADFLAAVWVAAAEIGAGAADALIACTWNKYSDVVDAFAIPALALEPAVQRPLGYHPDAVLALRRSAETGSITTTSQPPLDLRDTASAFILSAAVPANGRILGVVTGVGASTGPYLKPGEPVLKPVQEAVSRALDMAARRIEDIAKVFVGGMARVDASEIARALGVPEEAVVAQDPPGADLGYAAGGRALSSALAAGSPEPVLVLSASGLGLESANALVLEQS
jgi:hypothetical protein